jgi:hypothetical protein
VTPKPLPGLHDAIWPRVHGFGDGITGQDLPRQFDDTYFDRVSQIGPAEALPWPIHRHREYFAGRASVRGGFRHAAGILDGALAANFVDRGGQSPGCVTNIPTGPSNVVQRLLVFTASGGANFYHVPATMVINDNTTTSLTVDFTDTILLSGTSMDYLFSQIELPEQLGVAAYAERLFWWGERAQYGQLAQPHVRWRLGRSGNGRPLGWAQDSRFGAGASREPSDVVWGDAYRITADGVTAARGMIEQNAITDADGDPLFANNTDYSVRARVKRSAGLSAGTLRINAYSPTAGRSAPGLR